MGEPKTTTIVVPLRGIASGENQPRAIYDQFSSRVMKALGTVTTARASHVEPGSELSDKAVANLNAAFVYKDDEGVTRIKPEYASHWFADMSPTGIDVVLGPFQPDQRDLALAEEVAWLRRHHVPVCASCADKQHTEVTPTGRFVTDKLPPYAEPNTQHCAENPALRLQELANIDYSQLELRVLAEARLEAATVVATTDSDPDLRANELSAWVIDGDRYTNEAWKDEQGLTCIVVFEENSCEIARALVRQARDRVRELAPEEE